MNSPASELLCSFVIEKAAEESISRRILLYRAVAAHVAEASPQFEELTKLADELDEIERRHAQLVLDFKRGAKG